MVAPDPVEQRVYDQLLDTASRPLMRALVGTYAFAPEQTTYSDGIRFAAAWAGQSRDERQR